MASKAIPLRDSDIGVIRGRVAKAMRFQVGANPSCVAAKQVLRRIDLDLNPSKVVAYRLEPIYELRPDSIASAALMQCMLTGEVLSGMGGGGEYLSPDVVAALRHPDTKIITPVQQGAPEKKA